MNLELALAAVFIISLTLVAVVVKARREAGLRRIVRRMGEEQGLIVAEPLERDGFRYDVAWKREVDGKPTHVFVLKKSKPLEALASLKHAYDLWRARGFYITDKRGVEEASRLLRGSFHEINGHVWVLTREDLKEVARLKARYGELLEKLKPTPLPEPLSPPRLEAAGWGVFDWLPPPRR